MASSVTNTDCAPFVSALSSAGVGSKAVTKAAEAAGAGTGEANGASALGACGAAMIARAGGPTGLSTALTALAVVTLGVGWNPQEGFAAPGASWKNPQEIDFDKYQIWYEKGGGRVFMKQFDKFRAEAEMNSWFRSRVLAHWNKDKMDVDWLDQKGMGLAHNTIKTVAKLEYAKQIKTNIEKVVKETTGKDHVIPNEDLTENIKKVEKEKEKEKEGKARAMQQITLQDVVDAHRMTGSNVRDFSEDEIGEERNGIWRLRKEHRLMRRRRQSGQRA